MELTTLILATIMSATLAWLGYSLAKKVVKPVSLRKIKRSAFESHFQKSEDKDFDSVYASLRKFQPKKLVISSAFKEQMARDLLRLGRKETPEDIRMAQFSLLLVMGILGGLLFLLHPVLGGIAWCLGAYGFYYPVGEIKEKIARLNKIIESEFPSFYRSCFYAYKYNTRSSLSSVIAQYAKEATPGFAQELSVLHSNILSLGEVAALREWKKLLPLPYVIRYVEYMEKRLEGEDNIDVMYSFKIELDNARQIQRTRDLESNLAKMKGVLELTNIPFTLILIVYFAAQIASSGAFEMFMKK